MASSCCKAFHDFSIIFSHGHERTDISDRLAEGELLCAFPPAGLLRASAMLSRRPVMSFLFADVLGKGKVLCQRPDHFGTTCYTII